MPLYFRPQKLIHYAKAAISFVLAFTVTIITGQYILGGFTQDNQVYLFTPLVLAYYTAIYFATHAAQFYIWPQVKALFVQETAMQFNAQTEPMLKTWHADVVNDFSSRFGIPQVLILIYDVSQHRFRTLFADASLSLPANHALAYVAKLQQQSLIDETMLKTLPEVTALDIQWLLKQYRSNRVIPLGADQKMVCGFIFFQSDQFTQADGEKVSRQFSSVLRQILQHDAIIHPEKTVQPKAPKISWPVGVTLISFIVLTIYWLASYPYIDSLLSSKFLFLFSNIYGVVAAWGGVWALIVARQWKTSKNISRALLFFGVGLLLQEFGQLSYAVYWQVLDVAIPYPSVGDIGYFGSVISYFFAALFLAKASGVTFRLRSLQAVVLAVLIPAGFLSVSFFLFLQGAEFDFNNPVRLFLDLGYPIFDAMYVSIAILTYLLTRDSGGRLRGQVFTILFGPYLAVCL